MRCFLFTGTVPADNLFQYFILSVFIVHQESGNFDENFPPSKLSTEFRLIQDPHISIFCVLRWGEKTYVLSFTTVSLIWFEVAQIVPIINTSKKFMFKYFDLSMRGKESRSPLEFYLFPIAEW